MTRRRLFIGLGLGVAVLLLGYLAMWFAVPSEERAYNRIALGMTRTEVEAVIGQPAGDYSDTVLRVTRTSHLALAREFGLSHAQSFDPDVSLDPWVWDEVGIGVAFDTDGKVAGCYLFKLSSSVGFLDRMRFL